MLSISAKEVQKKSSGSYLITYYTKSILNTIKADIISASKNGHTKTIIQVPTNFDVAGMSNQTAQTIIYYNIIRELENKGFTVNMSMEESAVTYCVRWEIEQDSNDLYEMRNVIASHMSKQTEKKTR